MNPGCSTSCKNYKYTRGFKGFSPNEFFEWEDSHPLCSNALSPSGSVMITITITIGLRTECTDKRLTQNAYYCGYDCDTMVNNVLVFGPDGKVFFCAINYPGSWADGTLTSRFFNHIQKRIGDFKICVDQGFPRSGDAHGILVRLIPKRSARRLHCSVHDNLICLSNGHWH